MRTRLMSGARLWPHLYEGVDRKNREVGLALGVVDQIQVDQLLQLDVLGLDTVHNVGEEHGHVLAHSHRSNDFFTASFFFSIFGLLSSSEPRR